MTFRHMIDGLMQVTGIANHCKLAWQCDLEHCIISKLWSGEAKNMDLTTFAKIVDGTKVPVEQIYEWYRMPEGAVLGKLRRDEVAA